MEGEAEQALLGPAGPHPTGEVDEVVTVPTSTTLIVPNRSVTKIRGSSGGDTA
jgi:hypothetical protein